MAAERFKDIKSQIILTYNPVWYLYSYITDKLIIANIEVNNMLQQSNPIVNKICLPVLLVLLGTIILFGCNKKPLRSQRLDQLFQNPPDENKPSGYWWWLYNNVDKASITKDLEEFRNKGLGSVLLVCTSNWSALPTPHGPEFLSSEWKELFVHALKEAHRLNLKVDVNIAPGWNMGGPWITPENACRWYIQSEVRLSGPKKFKGKLPVPEANDGYNDKPMLGVKRQLTVSMEEADYRDASVVAFLIPDKVETGFLKNFREDLGKKSSRSDGSCFVPADKVMSDPRQPWVNSEKDVPIDQSAVINLTNKLDEDGTFEWEVPPGDWMVIRTGHRMTGAHLSVPLPGMEGLENDFLGRAGVEQMFIHTGKVLAELAGPLAGNTLRAFCNDSFEAGYPNWTDNMAKQFKKYRGYDITPYLPVLRGYIVGSAEISDRFLHDFRKTIADCMADEHYGRLAELAGKYGIESRAEAAGPNWSSTMCMDGLKNLGRTHYPQGEFWRFIFQDEGQNKVGKQTASAAHIYGIRTASAEALTSSGIDPSGRSIHWSAHPANMKPLIDRAFCEGINNMVFHTMTAQKEQDGLPGYEYGAGTHFTPNVTWWDMAAKDWLKYIGRCQTLLQSGLFVADVLYYNGDWAPNLVRPKHRDPNLGQGYDYDVCNEEVLLKRLSVQDGRLVLPDGMSYRILVLPQNTRLPLEVAQKLVDLVRSGATIVGPRPLSDPGLKNYPDCDDMIKKIADDLWGEIDGNEIFEHVFGKGRVIWGRSLRDILIKDNVPPDFVATGQPDVFIDFIHRRTPNDDFYFLVNRNNRPEEVELTFRQKDRQPECWDPVSGMQRKLPEYMIDGEQTKLPLKFEPGESTFIVFRGKAKKLKGKNIAEYHSSTKRITGPWNVKFDKDWFYPIKSLDGNEAKGIFTFDKLNDWSDHEEEAIKYFSGTAKYDIEFREPEDFNTQSNYYLDLGEVNIAASVRLNGKDLGVLWCPPWRVDANKAIRKGINKLEIEVTNCWPNRLIGDGKLPQKKRRTNTNINVYYKPLRNGKDHKLLPSGLIGPVTLIRKKAL